jgi:endosialidase-like protein
MPWELNGNDGVTTNNFVGTRNNAPLIIKTNTNGSPANLEEVLRVTPSSQTQRGRVGIGTTSPTQSLTLGAGNVQLPNAQAGTDGNLYFGGRTDARETGMRLFGGLVNGTIPGGFIDVRTSNNAEGLRIRVDTNDGGSEKIRITPTGIQALVPISQPSDVRTKTKIRQLDGSLDKLACIRGIAFEWSDAPTSTERPGQSNIGVIAQEVEAVFPELVSVYGDEGYKAVNYTGLTAALIEAAKELKAENERLRQRIEALEQKA